MVVRDSTDLPVLCKSNALPFSSPQQVEAEAIRTALNWRLEDGQKSSIESDAKGIVEAIHGKNVVQWQAASEILTCQQLLKNVNTTIKFIPRLCNFAAHQVARFAISSGTGVHVLGPPGPICISDVITRELNV